MKETSNIIDELKKYFSKRKDIALAFLFGSVAKGRQISESDVDIAVWFFGDEFLEKATETQREIETLLHKDVDLIVLNSARPTIAWAALRGKALLIRDQRLYFNQLLEVSTEAEDMQDFNLDLFRMRQKNRAKVSN